MKHIIFLMITSLLLANTNSKISLGTSYTMAKALLETDNYVNTYRYTYERDGGKLTLGVFEGKVTSIYYRNKDGGKSYEILSKVYSTKTLAINCKDKEKMFLDKLGDYSVIFIVQTEDEDCSEEGLDSLKSYKIKAFGER